MSNLFIGKELDMKRNKMGLRSQDVIIDRYSNIFFFSEGQIKILESFCQYKRVHPERWVDYWTLNCGVRFCTAYQLLQIQQQHNTWIMRGSIFSRVRGTDAKISSSLPANPARCCINDIYEYNCGNVISKQYSDMQRSNHIAEGTNNVVISNLSSSSPVATCFKAA